MRKNENIFIFENKKGQHLPGIGIGEIVIIEEKIMNKSSETS